MTGSCNNTQIVIWKLFRGSFHLWMLLAVISTMLVFSLCWNIFCCFTKRVSGKKFFPSLRRSTRFEDNPIYGNISYTQARVDSPATSSSDHQRVEHNSQLLLGGQDCYANLTLKATKPLSGCSSSKIQYSDVILLQGSALMESEKGAMSNTDTISVLSDLYASVPTDRTKTLDTGKCIEGYANHV